MNNKEYQTMELRRFQTQRNKFFDTEKDFIDDLTGRDILTDLEWIENGSYGAGACLELQRVFNYLTPRMNKNSHVGAVLFHALYGAQFRGWNKISGPVQAMINKAVSKWIKSKKDWAIVITI